MATAKAKTKGAKTKAEAAKAEAAPAEVMPAAPPKVDQAAAPAVSTPVHKAHGFRRKLTGRVTSNKMDKTVTVEVIRKALDPVYKKYVRMRERYKAHDPENSYKIGDRVEIQEHRPISRGKRWLVTRVISRSVEE